MKNCTRLDTRRGKKRKGRVSENKRASPFFQGQRVWSLLINKCYFDQRSRVTVRPCANGTLSWVSPQSPMGISGRACKHPDPTNPRSHSHLSRALLVCFATVTHTLIPEQSTWQSLKGASGGGVALLKGDAIITHYCQLPSPMLEVLALAAKLPG